MHPQSENPFHPAEEEPEEPEVQDDLQMPDDRPHIETNEAFEEDQNLDKIGRNIKQLKYGDLSQQVDALVILNEIITS